MSRRVSLVVVCALNPIPINEASFSWFLGTSYAPLRDSSPSWEIRRIGLPLSCHLPYGIYIEISLNHPCV